MVESAVVVSMSRSPADSARPPSGRHVQGSTVWERFWVAMPRMDSSDLPELELVAVDGGRGSHAGDAGRRRRHRWAEAAGSTRCCGRDDEVCGDGVVDAGGGRAWTGRHRTPRWPRRGPARPSGPTRLRRAAAGCAWSSHDPTGPRSRASRASGRPMTLDIGRRHGRGQHGHPDEDQHRAEADQRDGRRRSVPGRAGSTPSTAMTPPRMNRRRMEISSSACWSRHRHHRGDPDGAAGGADGRDDRSRRHPPRGTR